MKMFDLTPLKRKWNEDPITTLAVGAAAVASAAKLIDTDGVTAPELPTMTGNRESDV